MWLALYVDRTPRAVRRCAFWKNRENSKKTQCFVDNATNEAPHGGGVMGVIGPVLRGEGVIYTVQVGLHSSLYSGMTCKQKNDGGCRVCICLMAGKHENEHVSDDLRVG